MLDVTVEDKVLAVGGIGVEVLTLSEFDGDDGANLLKQTDNFLLFDLRWDVLDKEVGFISFAHAALDGRSRVSVLGSDLILSLGDVLANEEVRAIVHLPFVHSIDGALGRLAVLERDVTLVRQHFLGTSSSLHMSRLNFTKFYKHLLETVVISAHWKALDKEIEEATLLALALFAALVMQHLNSFAVKLENSGLFDSAGCGLLAFKLDVSETSAFTVWVELKLTRANWPEGQERIVELLLRHGEVNIPHEHVRLGLHEVAFLKIAADVIVADFRVVKLRSAPFGLLKLEELEEAVAILALRLLVHIDDCLVDIESQLLYMLV